MSSTHSCDASSALSGRSGTLSVGEVGDLEYVEQSGVTFRGAFGYVGVAMAVMDDNDKDQKYLHCIYEEDCFKNEEEQSTVKGITC